METKVFNGERLLLLGGVRQAIGIVEEAKKLGLTVYVTDNRTDSPAKKVADKSFMVNATDVDAVVQLCREEKIDGLITGYVDMLLPYAQQICEKLGFPFWGDAKNIEMCINKDMFKRACEHAGVPTVPWKEVTRENYREMAAGIKLPVVIKPVDNSGSRGVFKCYVQEELIPTLEKALSFSPCGKLLVEKCMNIHNEFSTYYIMNHGNYYLTCMGDRFVTEISPEIAPVGRGMICPSRHLDLWMKEVDGAVKNFFDENNMKNGFAFMQGFYDEDDNKLYVHEIGYRAVGGFSYKYVEHYSGFNRIRELIRFAMTGSMDQSEIEKSNPYFDGYAVTVTASLMPGRISKIEGVEKIRAMKNVIYMLPMYSEGDVIKESTQGTLASVFSYFLCVVKNKAELTEIIDTVKNELIVLDENGSSMLNEIMDPSEIEMNEVKEMNNKIDFVYLNEQDMIKAGVTDMPKCVSAMEDMFTLLYKGDYRMGGDDANEHGIRVSFPKTSDIEGMPLHAPDYRFMAMPAYLGGRFHMFGIKDYGSHHTNKEKGLPRSILMMSLKDIDTGAPLAYMSANILSAMRTAATAGVGTKYLTKKNPKVLGVIGPGVMSTYTLDAIMVTQPSITVLKVKGRGIASLNKFMEHAKAKYPCLETVVACDSIEETCKDADIIYFGTTNAAKFEDNPRIEQKWVKKGALVISASALLISTDFLSDPGVKLVADNYLMYEGWGAGRELPTQKTVSTLLGMGFYDAVCEKKIKRTDIADMGGILLGEQTGRDSEDQIIVYAVGGMPVEDVAWAYDVYQNALAKGIGTKLKLWDEPELMR